MGTHPIFESDFDCLTDRSQIYTGKGMNSNSQSQGKQKSELYRFSNFSNLFQSQSKTNNLMNNQNNSKSEENFGMGQKNKSRKNDQRNDQSDERPKENYL